MFNISLVILYLASHLKNLVLLYCLHHFIREKILYCQRETVALRIRRVPLDW